MTDDPPGGPQADVAAAVIAVRTGDLEALRQVLARRPTLVDGPLPGHGGRSLLHVAVDWPGHRPLIAHTVEVLVEHGAVVDAPYLGEHSETALHWAASNDDVAALDALLDAGATIDAPGGVIGGGTPLADATAFGQWAAARRLVERGSPVTTWEAAALGMTELVAQHVAAQPDTELEPLLWGAAHGGRLDTVISLVEAGADYDWVGWDDLTALDAAERAGAADVVGWLEVRGARRRRDLG